MEKTIDWLVGQKEKDRYASPNEEMAVTFFGGEPLLNFPVVKHGMLYTKERYADTGMNVGIYILSNGTVVTDEMIDFFREARKWKRVNFHMQISMDGCEVSHDKYRKFQSGGGSFQKINENISKLKTVFPNLIIRQTVVPGNVQMLSEDYKYLLQTGARTINLTPAVEGDWNTEVINTYTKELGKCVALFLSHPNKSRMFTNIIQGAIDRMGDTNYSSFRGCRAGKSMVGVSIEGDIYPCHRFIAYRDMFDYRLGDVFNGIDYNSDNWKKLEEMHRSTVSCGGCPSITCNRCYATNLSLSKESAAKPDNGYCEMNLESTKYLTELVWRNIMDKQVEIPEGEMISDGGKIAINVGEGTEVYNDLIDVMSRCMVRMVKEMSIVKSKVSQIETKLGIETQNKCDLGHK